MGVTLAGSGGKAEGMNVPIEGTIVIPEKLDQSFEPPGDGNHRATVRLDGEAAWIEPGPKDPPYLNGVMIEERKQLEHGDQIAFLDFAGTTFTIEDSVGRAAAETAQRQKDEQIGKLKRLADDGRLPLRYTVEFKAPKADKQPGIMVAGEGTLRLIGREGEAFSAPLGGLDEVDCPRRKGSLMKITVGGTEYEVVLGEYVPPTVPGAVDADAGPIEFDDMGMEIAEEGGAGDTAELLEGGLDIAFGVLNKFGSRAQRSEWQEIIEGEVKPEEVATRHLEAYLEEQKIIAEAEAEED